MSNTICNLWSKRARSAEPREAPPGQKSGAGLRPPAIPSQGTGSEVRLGSGSKRLRQEPPPVFPLGLRFPLPFLQKSIHPDSRGVAGLAEARPLSAVLTRWSSRRTRLQQRAGLPPLLSARRPFYSLSRTRRNGQWRRISLVFFYPWVCVGAESGPNERGSGGIEPVRVPVAPPPRRRRPQPPGL